MGRNADRHLFRFIRADIAFAIPQPYKILEVEAHFYAPPRFRTNSVLQGEMLIFASSPWVVHAKGVKHIYGDFEYQAVSWDKPRGVVAKAELIPASVMCQQADDRA
jgi:hypothetical protein